MFTTLASDVSTGETVAFYVFLSIVAVCYTAYRILGDGWRGK